MKKRNYEKPTTKVVELKHKPQLLAGSDASTNLQNYTVDGEVDW